MVSKMGKTANEEICYIIRYSPYTWEEMNDKMYHANVEQINELYTDETEFNARITELENFYSNIYDGVDIDGLYWCEMHRITSR